MKDAVAALAAWLTAASLGAPPGLRPLADTEIAATVVGQELRTGSRPAPGLEHFSEHFQAGGFYMFLGARVPLSGRYSITAGRLCVDRPPRRDCRRVFKDAQGRLYLQVMDAAATPIRYVTKPLR